MSDFFRTRPKAERRRFSTNRGTIPRGLRAIWVEPGHEEDDGNVELYEYLIAHEVFLVEPRGSFICTAHAAARAAVARGRIFPSFSCPLASSDCPMRALLDVAPGHEVRLVATEEGR